VVEKRTSLLSVRPPASMSLFIDRLRGVKSDSPSGASPSGPVSSGGFVAPAPWAIKRPPPTRKAPTISERLRVILNLAPSG